MRKSRFLLAVYVGLSAVFVITAAFSSKSAGVVWASQNVSDKRAEADLEEDTEEDTEETDVEAGSEDIIFEEDLPGNAGTEKMFSDRAVSGNMVSGNTVSGNTVSGNTVSGNTVSGNTVFSNTVSVSAVSDNAVTGAPVSGNTVFGNTVSGSAVSDNAVTGTPVSGNSVSGNTVSVSTVSDNAVTGAPVSGNTVSGSTVSDNAVTDAPVSGNTVSGNTVSGSTVSDNTVTDAPVSGNTVSGNMASGNTVSGSTVSDNTVTGLSVSENTAPAYPRVLPEINFSHSLTGDNYITLAERQRSRTSYAETLHANERDLRIIQESTVDFSDVRIAFLGDSITEAINLDKYENYRELSYPAVVGRALNAEAVYNLGIGGSSIGRYWDKAFVDRYQEIPEDTDLILIMGGTNDGFCADLVDFGTEGERKPRTFWGDLDELMRGLRENYSHAEVIFLTPLPNNLHDLLKKDHPYLIAQEQYAKVIRQLAEEYGFTLIDLYNSNILDAHDKDVAIRFMPDGVHPNERGYQILGEHVAAELIRIFSESD